MADNRGRDGGFRGANRNTDRKPRGDKPGFGEKKFGEKKVGDKKPYGERTSVIVSGDWCVKVFVIIKVRCLRLIW